MSEIDTAAAEQLIKGQLAEPALPPPDGLLSAVERTTLRINGVVAGIGGLLIVVLVALTTVDVAGRYLLNKPLAGTLEMQQILLAFIALMPLAYTLATGGHVRFQLLIDRLGRRARAALDLLAAVLGLGVFSVLFWGGYQSFESSWRVKELMSAPIPLPYWLPKGLLPLGAALMILQLLVVAARQLATLTRPDDPDADEPGPAGAGDSPSVDSHLAK